VNVLFCMIEYLNMYSSLIFFFFWSLLMIFLFIYINNYQFILLNACICFSIYTLKFFILKNTLKHFACPIYFKKKQHYHGKLRVKWLLHECIWYCGSCCSCDLKKVVFIKNTFSCGWFGKIYVWLKL